VRRLWMTLAASAVSRADDAVNVRRTRQHQRRGEHRRAGATADHGTTITA